MMIRVLPIAKVLVASAALILLTSTEVAVSTNLYNCEGDCDRDSDCDGHLICYQRNAHDPVPCCPHIPTGSNTDYCAPSGCTTTPSHPTPHPTRRPTPAPTVQPPVNVIVCFSGDTTVEVLDKGTVPMKDLQVGEKVLTYSSEASEDGAGREGYYEYVPVYAFGHHNANVRATFLKVETTTTTTMTNQTGSIDLENAAVSTTATRTTLEITRDHLIYLMGQNTPVKAGTLKLGDRIAPHNAIVTSIDSITKKGIYAPLTTTGHLLVNDGGNLLVSSYAAVVQQGQQQEKKRGEDQQYWKLAVTTGKHNLNNDDDGMIITSHHNGVHTVLTPYRMWCRAALLLNDKYKCDVNKAHNNNNNIWEEGMPPYVSKGIQILEWIDQQSLPIQILLLIVGSLIFSCLLVIEKLAFERTYNGVLVLLAGTSCVAVLLLTGTGASSTSTTNKCKKKESADDYTMLSNGKAKVN